jgi:hypothetical protein
VGTWTGLVASKASIRSSFRVKTVEKPPNAPWAWLSRRTSFANVATFTPDEHELIMRLNARQLTFD